MFWYVMLLSPLYLVFGLRASSVRKAALRAPWGTDEFLASTGSWQKPDGSTKTLRRPTRLRHFGEQRITVHELAA